MGGWGKVRAPTMARLAEAMETRPKVTGKAYAAIISRSRPAGGLGCEDKRAVAEWADACFSQENFLGTHGLFVSGLTA